MLIDSNTSKGRFYISVLVIAFAITMNLIKYFLRYIIPGESYYQHLDPHIRGSLIMIISVILCVIIVLVISNFSLKTFKEMLGLNREFMFPFIIALLCNIPSFVGYAYLNGLQQSTLSDVLFGSILPGLNEEIIFRAFIVGLLARYAGWNFWLAVLISSFIFAYGHLYQSSSIPEGIKIFLFTSGAGIGFALFFKYWQWNIWFPVFMHIFMNMAFILFVKTDNVLLDKTENIFRFSTLALAILVTGYIDYRGRNKLTKT